MSRVATESCCRAGGCVTFSTYVRCEAHVAGRVHVSTAQRREWLTDVGGGSVLVFVDGGHLPG